MLKFHNISINKECIFDFSGTEDEVSELCSILDEKILKKTILGDDRYSIKTTLMRFFHDGDDLWFFFVKRPYLYLKKRIKEKNYQCWMRITGK